MSDDGQFGITLIAFVGSVFSPYYKRSGRLDPEDHCALNVALYGPRAARWAMTEHSARHVKRFAHQLQIARSSLTWSGDRLTIDIEETTTPWRRPIRGRVTVQTDGLSREAFLIDDQGRHRWRPFAPSSRVCVDLREPDLAWSGAGYFDSNEGDEPLEEGFDYWDWSRINLDGQKTAIFYNTDMTSGASRLSAFLVDQTGDLQEIETPPEAKLPPTTLWRIRRRTRAEAGPRPRILQTLEDTPFYSRSIIETPLFGTKRRAIHESLCGPRLNAKAVQFMLPYRMPRVE